MGEALTFLPKTEGRHSLPDGTVIIIECPEADNDNGDYGDVEEHEAEHAVVAIKNGTSVIEASVIPEGNSLGHVKLGSFDPVAASTSKGRRGNGHDKHIVESAGHSFESNGNAAHGIIGRNKRAVRAVASALSRKKHLTGGQIQEIINRAEGGEKIRIHIFTPDGKEKILTKEMRRGEKMLSVADLPIEKTKVA